MLPVSSSSTVSTMKFSLILATLNRTEEVKLFLQTLDAQTHRNFELIVVDQNKDDRLVSVLQPYQDRFQILHLRSTPGLSYARNVALKHLSGDLVAFPDDDCGYPADLLDRVATFFINYPKWNGLTGRSINEQGDNSSGKWDSKAGQITQINVWRRGASYTIFLRLSTVTSLGPFDETLGVGASTPWGSGEDIDYLLRATSMGIYYDPNLTIIHPLKVANLQENLVTSNKPTFFKTYSYALGRGRVLRKHNTPLWFVLYNWVRPLIGILLSLPQGNIHRTRSYLATLQGRVQGWLGWV